MKDQYVYVIVEIATGQVVMVHKTRDTIDEEFFSKEYSNQRVYFWR